MLKNPTIRTKSEFLAALVFAYSWDRSLSAHCTQVLGHMTTIIISHVEDIEVKLQLKFGACSVIAEWCIKLLMIQDIQPLTHFWWCRCSWIMQCHVCSYSSQLGTCLKQKKSGIFLLRYTVYAWSGYPFLNSGLWWSTAGVCHTWQLTHALIKSAGCMVLNTT